MRGSWLPKAVHFLLLFAMVGHFGQLCVVFYKYFDTRLCLTYVFYSEFGTLATLLLLFIVNRSPVSQIELFFTIVWRANWHMGNFFAAIYCQSEPCKSHLVVFYNSLACLSHSVGPRERRPSRIQIASQRHIRSCNGYSVWSGGGHNRWEL